MPTISSIASGLAAAALAYLLSPAAAGAAGPGLPAPGFAAPGIAPRSISPAPEPAAHPPGGGRTPEAPPALKGLRRYDLADVDAGGLRRRLEGFRRGAFRLELGSRAWDLELEPSSIRAPGYRVRHLTAAGVVEAEPTPERSFRGRVRGMPGSSVRLAFEDGAVNGFVDPGEGDRYFVEPLANLGKAAYPAPAGRVPHVVYRDRDVLPDTGVSCGLAGPGQPAPIAPPELSPRVPGSGSAPGIRVFPGSAIEGTEIALPPSAFGGTPLGKSAASAEPCALVELAVAVHYSMVRGLGGAQAAERRINDIYNMVDGLYQDPRVNIHVRISEIFIETADNATWGAAMDINQYLTSMTSWMRGPNGFKQPFDVGSLWYYSLGGGTVGLAYVGVVCGNTRANVIRYFTATTRSMVIDAAHELGHNFSAPHMSNPAWIMNPSITGSNDQWDSASVARITGHKRSRTCLSVCEVAPIADFAMSGASSCAETRVFTDRSAGEPTAWQWQFGDGAVSTLRNPTHTYATPGKYTVTLSASNAFGANATSRSNIRVKPIPAPTATDADGCPPAALTLTAQGSGTLRWYDTATGGVVLAAGPQFTTPVLTRARTYYVENGDPDMPITKVGPVSTSLGPGAQFTANGERRLFFDVHRPAILVSVKVNAGGAGPRLVEILDAKLKRVHAKSVQVPAGESRVPLGFALEPGSDYAIKVVGAGDSANLFRNTSGADYPYVSPDTLVTITGSDATAADTVTQSGYYYFFYDWEIRESPCASVRVPVQAKLTCTSDLASGAGAGPFRAALRPVSHGRYLLHGSTPDAGTLRIRIRSLDGALVRTLDLPVAAGALALPVAVPASSRLLTADIQLGTHRSRAILQPF